MKLNVKPRDEVKRALEAEREKRPAVDEPRPLNARVVARITTDELLAFGQPERYYLVPPVSFEAGGQLTDLLIQVQNIGKIAEPTRDDVAALRAVLREAVKLMHGLIRPLRYRHRIIGPFVRLAWGFRRNPFRHATSEEVGYLLGFFSQRRTTRRIRHGEGTNSR